VLTEHRREGLKAQQSYRRAAAILAVLGVAVFFVAGWQLGPLWFGEDIGQTAIWAAVILVLVGFVLSFAARTIWQSGARAGPSGSGPSPAVQRVLYGARWYLLVSGLLGCLGAGRAVVISIHGALTTNDRITGVIMGISGLGLVLTGALIWLVAPRDRG